MPYGVEALRLMCRKIYIRPQHLRNNRGSALAKKVKGKGKKEKVSDISPIIPRLHPDDYVFSLLKVEKGKTECRLILGEYYSREIIIGDKGKPIELIGGITPIAEVIIKANDLENFQKDLSELIKVVNKDKRNDKKKRK